MYRAVFLIILFQVSVLYSQEHDDILNQLEYDISFLANDSLEGRAIGSRGEIIASNYISSEFKKFGIEPIDESNSYIQHFSKKIKANPHHNTSAEVITGRNVIGFIDNQSKTTIVVGAHFDHLGWGDFGSLHNGKRQIHNGADDNASGVAGLLYLANSLNELSLNNNVLVVAFSGEERGLLGSNYFINNVNNDIGEINFMINMDMIGRLDSTNSLAIYGAGTSPVFIPTINEVNNDVFQLKLDSSGMGPSDHASFYMKDIPVLHFFTGQHGDYHKPSDDVEKINFEGLSEVVLFINKLIVNLDKKGELLFTKTIDKKSERSSFNVTFGVMPDYMFSGKGVKIDGVKTNRPASNAGMLNGDIIVKIDEKSINDIYDYMDQLKIHKKGDEVSVSVLRDDKTISMKVTF